jgi:hypothetical protein
MFRTIRQSRRVSDIDLPRPERDHETKPGEEEDATVDTDHIEQRHRASLVVDWVELWSFPEQRRIEYDHVDRTMFRKVDQIGLSSNCRRDVSDQMCPLVTKMLVSR